MPRYGNRQWLALALALSVAPVRARAEAPRTAADDDAAHAVGRPAAHEPVDDSSALLQGHLALLEKKRLSPSPAESVDELDALLEEAHQRALAGSKDEAAMLLLEAVEGPRFRSFEGLDSFAAADLMLASLLLEQRALIGAERSVDRLLARGPDSATFGSAYRRAVDIALARGDYAASAAGLAAKLKVPLPADAADELHYLRGLAAHTGADLSASRRELAAVSNKSRFYANALYLLGAIAARENKYDEARLRFVAVREIAKGPSRMRYEGGQRFATEDLAHLGLGRVAHEQGRSKDAFEHYFKVPNDSPLLAEALFESAFASYERGQPRTALDSLEQLEARYPDSSFTAEARVLRGYVHLQSSDFERAEQELLQFEQTFGGVLLELDATLASPQRTASLFRAQSDSLPAASAAHDGLLLGLLQRDPEVERLRRALSALDAELARSSRVGEEFAALAARARGKELPRARPIDDPADQEQRIDKLRVQSAELGQALVGLARELRELRAGGAKADEIAQLHRTQRTLEKRSEALAAALRQLVRRGERVHERPMGAEIGERLDQDRLYVESVRSRALRVRDDLEAELAKAEQRALEGLRERLQKELRRARIGRVDAVMGKKRKLELEVESLSAGRFPPELASEKRRSTLLSDDEEYWPFEGEDWPDEFEESR